jgi:membrane protease YdiL (CAAX protease family)
MAQKRADVPRSVFGGGQGLEGIIVTVFNGISEGHMDAEKKAGLSHNVVMWIVISGLLILRFPILTGVSMISTRPVTWLEPVYQIGTYLLTAFLIWWERDRLASFHIDPLVIGILMIFKPLETIILPMFGTNTPLAFPHPLSFSFLVIAIGLLVALWRSHLPPIQNIRKSLFWLLIGAVAGLTLVTVVAISEIQFLHLPVPPAVGALALLAPIYQMGYAAVDEEPLFRGFLWGALKSLGLKDHWILLIQASLFALGHSYFLGSPHALLNIAIIFGFALCLGLLVWRSRTIASSMGAHAFWNGSTYFLSVVLPAIFK